MKEKRRERKDDFENPEEKHCKHGNKVTEKNDRKEKSKKVEKEKEKDKKREKKDKGDRKDKKEKKGKKDAIEFDDFKYEKSSTEGYMHKPFVKKF